MGLFDNINLMDLIMSGKSQPANQNLAKKADLGTNDFSKIASVGLPLILNAINRNTRTDEGLDSFDRALNKHQDIQNYQSIDELTQNVDLDDGNKILGHLFQSKQEEQGLIDRIADMFGMTPSAVKRALIVIAPMILKYMADQKQSKKLDRRGLQNETSNTVEKLNTSLRNYGSNRQASDRDKQSDSLFDSLLAGVKKTQGQSKSPQNNQSEGLLGNILDIFR